MNFDLIIKNLKMIEESFLNSNLQLQYLFNNEWYNVNPNDYNENQIGKYHLEYFSRKHYRLISKKYTEYRSYSDVNEYWYLKKVKLKEYNEISSISSIDFESKLLLINGSWKTLNEMFEYYIWGKNNDDDDEKPFGELIYKK